MGNVGHRVEPGILFQTFVCGQSRVCVLDLEVFVMVGCVGSVDCCGWNGCCVGACVGACVGGCCTKLAGVKVVAEVVEIAFKVVEVVVKVVEVVEVVVKVVEVFVEVVDVFKSAQIVDVVVEAA